MFLNNYSKGTYFYLKKRKRLKDCNEVSEVESIKYKNYKIEIHENDLSEELHNNQLKGDKIK